MRNSNSNRSSRQSQERSTGSRGMRGGQRSSSSGYRNDYESSRSNDYESSRFGGRSDRGSYGRISDDDSRYSTDDGGYYSNRNFGSQSDRDDRGAHYAPYRSSEQNYESNSRWDNDGYGQSRWNRPDEDDRNERSRRPERNSRWGREDFGWGGQMSGRDQEMGFNSDMTDEDNYRDFEGMSGGRSARYSDVDDVEGQYDEDYRDRDSYSRSRRGSSSGRSSHGSRR